MNAYTAKQSETLAATSGVDRLRAVVRMCDACNESFVQRFTAAQLVTIWFAYLLCDWDYTPDMWHDRQVKRALGGIVPEWDGDSSTPSYDDETSVCFDTVTGEVRS